MILVSRQAPDFTATAVIKNNKFIENFNFKENTLGKYVFLFFWPMDFTFVCPSEIIAINNRYEEFKKRKVEIIGVSIDSHFVHLAWKNTPIEKGGIGNIKYPIIADVKHEIQQSYGIEHPDLGISLRASFFIDNNGVVRHQIVNDLPLGRNIDEIIRIIDAWKFYKNYGEVCPAQWEKGKKGIKPTIQGVSEYLSKYSEKI